MLKKQITYEFPIEKNQWLLNERGISFEIIIAAIENDQLLDIIYHPNQSKYPHQKMYVLYINEYVYLVPFVEKNEETIFLKTAFASRKATKLYIKGGK
jgi:hypothetical protein